MTRIAINGFGRMGRLFCRAAIDRGLDVVALNEPAGTAENLALGLEFDSVQGRWNRTVEADDSGLKIGDCAVTVTQTTDWGALPWREREVDLVVECSGRVKRDKTRAEPHFTAGARRVLASHAIDDAPNIVYGVNHDAFDLTNERLVTAASCTTNCLAPVVRVLHDAIGIERGVVTTIHDPTNTQTVTDRADKDPRRGRSALVNLIPTSTNSASAVTMIIPELQGRLDSIAVRAPVLNASITDCAFAMARSTTVDEVNAALGAAAASGPLQGILGYETRPLVSSDFAGDPRSGIVDARSTRVVDGTLVKVLAWYDNEWGYANRLVDLAQRMTGG